MITHLLQAFVHLQTVITQGLNTTCQVKGPRGITIGIRSCPLYTPHGIYRTPFLKLCPCFPISIELKEINF